MPGWSGREDGPGQAEPVDDGAEGIMADSEGERCGEARGHRRDESEERATGVRETMANADLSSGRYGVDGNGSILGTAAGRWNTRSSIRRRGAWTTEPDVGRVAHGIPSRVDRLKCLGNSIVPQIAELIFRGIKDQP
jgi:DNA (cytosine-5)-methyltransferase 1